LHDAIGGILSAAKLNFSAAKKENEAFDNAQKLLDLASSEVRRISHNMTPEILLKEGLIPAIEDFCYHIQQAKGLNIDIQTFELPTMSEKVNLAIFRILQELINNTLKHAKATEILIQLNGGQYGINITFEDNGLGFDYQHISKGLGLKNIEKRISAMNGTLDLKSTQNQGASFFITLPKTSITETKI
jgi:two-component system, NarL family, sensor kinase